MTPELYRTFLSFISHNRISDVFRLVNSGVDVKHNGHEPIILACSSGHISMVKALIRLGAEILPVKDRCLAVVPDKSKARLEQIIWNLESGVESRRI